MPFSAAHPAAALPLARPLGRFASVSGLVIGSIVPDVPYFLPGLGFGFPSHSLSGLVVFCLPVGAALYCIFHVLFAPLLSDLAPRALRGRLPITWKAGRLPPHSVAAVVVSLLVGAMTHLAWDSITHASGVVVQAAPILATPLFSYEGYTVVVYKILQRGSILLGLGIMSRWGLQWLRLSPLRQSEPAIAAPIRVMLVVLLLVPPTVAAVSGAWFAFDSGFGRLRLLQIVVGAMVIKGGTALLATALLLGGLWRLVRQRVLQHQL